MPRTYPTAPVTPAEGQGHAHTQFSSSSFRGSVSSSTSSFAFPFFLPFAFPLPALVVAVGGFFSFSVALLSSGGARLPRGCGAQHAELGKAGAAAASPLRAHTRTYMHARMTHARSSQAWLCAETLRRHDPVTYAG